MNVSCPGASAFKQPQPENIRCPFCDYELEMWTDEIKARCPHCKKTVTRKQAPTCLDWCKYARECAGDAVFKDYMQNKRITVKEGLVKALEAYFGNDTKRINHAQKVMHYANELLQKEPGDWHIVIPASILHDVGIKAAEEKYGSSAARYQEIEGPAIARNILLKAGFKKADIDQICEIIGHHHSPGKMNSQNFKLLYDADMLVNLKEKADLKDKSKLREIIKRAFFTEAAKKIAAGIYCR